MLNAKRFVIRAALSRSCQAVLRGGALFLGGYVLLSWLLYWAEPMRYDANIWWVDLRPLPGPIAFALSVVFAVALLHRAIVPKPARVINRMRTAVLILLVGILILNSLTAWGAGLNRISDGPQGVGGVWLGMPIPLTLLIAIGVLAMIRSPGHDLAAAPIPMARRFVGIVALAGLFAIVGALAQMVWFGQSDYRRDADAIVVFGCRAYPDGQPSQALADRVHTACQLYHQGLAPVLVMSGGPVDESMHETQAMADYAVSLGVPRSAIVLDRLGLDTQATAENLRHVLAHDAQAGPLRILAVSHDYHLPRVKLSFERMGITAYTVPCEIRRGLPSKPYLIARETAAWWYYYLSPLVASTR